MPPAIATADEWDWSLSKLRDGDVLARARTTMPSLTPSDRRIAQFVLSDPDRVVECSVSEIAALTSSGTATVVRACQSLGYKGFQDLKLALVRDLALQRAQGQELTHAEGISEATPPSAIIETVIRASGQALASAARTLDSAVFARAVDMIERASRMLVVGNGTSAAPAHDAAHRFTSLGILTLAPADAIAQHLAASQLDATTVCLVISHTGATRETLTAAGAAKDAGAVIVAITSFLRSPLTDLADLALIAGGPERGFRLEAMSSRLAHLAVIDALFVGVAVARPRRSTAALDAMANVTAGHSL